MGLSLYVWIMTDTHVAKEAIVCGCPPVVRQSMLVNTDMGDNGWKFVESPEAGLW